METSTQQHYILTRFNLKQKDWATDKNNNSLLSIDDTWLEERFNLFETYCLPSVKAQTCKNFKWLVYFDTDTPGNYKTRIESYRASFPNFLPRFIPGMEYLLNSIKTDIAGTPCETIITTRLDNDDSLHENFISKVQSVIQHNHITNGVIDISNGFCLQVQPKAVLAESTQHSNAFITYIEPFKSIDDIKTVLHKSHGGWAYSVKTYVIKKERLWMQIIHGKNVLNKVQGIIVNNKAKLAKFNLAINIDFEENNLKKKLYNKYVKSPLYSFKKQLKKLSLIRRTLRK